MNTLPLSSFIAVIALNNDNLSPVELEHITKAHSWSSSKGNAHIVRQCIAQLRRTHKEEQQC
jgi:hypothetical protein